jgi:Transmembrane protein 33/Nucleoporin POM33
MWFFTTPIFLALVPYFIYSIFHVITYFSEYVLPAITARPARPKEDKLAQLAHKYQDLGSQTVAKVEVYGILIRLLLAILVYHPPLSPLLLFFVLQVLFSFVCPGVLTVLGSRNWHSSNSPYLQSSSATSTSTQPTPAPPSAPSQCKSTVSSTLYPPRSETYGSKSAIRSPITGRDRWLLARASRHR